MRSAGLLFQLGCLMCFAFVYDDCAAMVDVGSNPIAGDYLVEEWTVVWDMVELNGVVNVEYQVSGLILEMDNLEVNANMQVDLQSTLQVMVVVAG